MAKESAPHPTRRLRVGWHDGTWVVEADEPAGEMILPGGLVGAIGEPVPGGFWYEVVDAAGRVLHRDALGDPHMVVEQFDEKGGIRGLPGDGPPGPIILLVPDVKGAEVRLYGDLGKSVGRARLLIRALLPVDLGGRHA